MSRTHKREVGKRRRRVVPATPRSRDSASRPLWVYALIAACFVAGVGGGALWRHRVQSPAALPAITVEPSAERRASTPVEASSTQPTTALQTPFQPPADKAERARTEQKFGALFRRGYENFHAERYAVAADDFQQAVQVAPYLAEGHYYLGEVYGKMLLNEKAEQAYRDSLRQMRDFDPAQKALCMLLHERGSYQEANELLRSIQLTKTNKAFVLGERAINDLALGEYQSAADLLQQYNAMMGRAGLGLRTSGARQGAARRHGPGPPTLPRVNTARSALGRRPSLAGFVVGPAGVGVGVARGLRPVRSAASTSESGT